MRFATLATLLFLLTACGIPSGVLVAGYAIDSASYVGTGKSVSDYALSAATKKDCSVLYGVTRGKICEDAPVKQAAAPSDTRVPDRVPPGNSVPNNVQMVTEPMMLGDTSTVEFDDAFANLATTKVSANISTNEVVQPAKPQPAKPQPAKSVSPAKTPLWVLVLGTFDIETAALDLVKQMRPVKGLISVTVLQGKVAYRVSTKPFKISEAKNRKAQLAHLELTDIHISRVCPAWMQDERCVVLDRVLSKKRADLK